MTDATLFAAGALFTQDYLVEGIPNPKRGLRPMLARSATGWRPSLLAFPHASSPNEATTESDLVWPVLRALGWAEYLTQQNLSDKGRVGVPDGLLFIDADAKAKANG